MTLAELLKKRRIKQVPLAKRLGVSQPTVSRWLSDKAMPSLKTVPKLARALHTTVDWEQYRNGRLRFKAS